MTTHAEVADEIEGLASELRTLASNIGDGEMAPVDMIARGNTLSDRMGDVLDLMRSLRG